MSRRVGGRPTTYRVHRAPAVTRRVIAKFAVFVVYALLFAIVTNLLLPRDLALAVGMLGSLIVAVDLADW